MVDAVIWLMLFRSGRVDYMELLLLCSLSDKPSVCKNPQIALFVCAYLEYLTSFEQGVFVVPEIVSVESV